MNQLSRTRHNPHVPSPGVRAAVGFRAHSGWAAMVALGEPITGLSAPISEIAAPARLAAMPAAALLQVIDRRRIELVDPGNPVQPYHAAADLELAEGEKLVEGCIDMAERLAREALCKAMESLRGKGYEVVGCGILLGSGRSVNTLAAILSSHAQIHTAEGDLFRNAIVRASECCGVQVTKVKERDLHTRAAAELGVPVDQLDRRLAELGRSLGPPWRQDEKYSTLAACLALRAASPYPKAP